MKRLLGIMIATTMTTASLASINQNGNVHYGKHIPIVIPAKTVTLNARAYVKSPRIPKFKLLRSNPYRYSKIIIDDIEYEIDDEGLMSPYRRRDLNKIEYDDELPHYIKWRLFLARQLAMLKYRAKFG